MKFFTVTERQNEIIILQDREEQVVLVERNAHANIITVGKVEVKITLQENAKLDYYHVVNEPGNLSSSQHIVLLGKNSSANVANLFYGSNEENSIISTVIEHESPFTQSRLVSRGIAVQQAKNKSTGLIKIGKKARNASGMQDIKTLVFDDAQAYAMPELAVDNNQVQCSHSSSVGQADEEQMFYMQSRGLSEEEAQLMIIGGFYEPVLASMPRQIQEQLRQIIRQRI